MASAICATAAVGASGPFPMFSGRQRLPAPAGPSWDEFPSSAQAQGPVPAPGSEGTRVLSRIRRGLHAICSVLT
ncbi:hypothetical protein FNF31_03127 [Cafeteria roenbergensis]|uniref:Uncharacterized protein n=1 Tax=Cafeteria roenbergensis TaxID=33653 RepID=A0A5A8DEJ5_CAFRO|nr:hypothetical protein FNF31_03127 [Cafeteria roenbergensis]